MNGHRIFTAVAALVAMFAGAIAQASHHQEVLTPELFETLKLDADDLYESRRYEEAFELFGGALSQHGDAYSQYMTGYMMRAGLGTEQDVPTGTAWMMLAGEQGNLQLMEAANLAAASLSPRDERKANRILRTLRAEYSNCALLDKLVDELKVALDGETGPSYERITVVYGDTPDTMSRDELRERFDLQRNVYRNHCVR